MKLFIALIVSLGSATVANAWGLESHYGKLTYSHGEYVCSYTNHGAAKDMKWVQFALERRGGESRDFSVKHKVDQVVGTGETISVGSGVNARFAGSYCKFLQR